MRRSCNVRIDKRQFLNPVGHIYIYERINCSHCRHSPGTNFLRRNFYSPQRWSKAYPAPSSTRAVMPSLPVSNRRNAWGEHMLCRQLLLERRHSAECPPATAIRHRPIMALGISRRFDMHCLSHICRRSFQRRLLAIGRFGPNAVLRRRRVRGRIRQLSNPVDPKQQRRLQPPVVRL